MDLTGVTTTLADLGGDIGIFAAGAAAVFVAATVGLKLATRFAPSIASKLLKG